MRASLPTARCRSTEASTIGPASPATLSNLGAILHAQNELDLAAATLDECILDCAKLGDDRLLALAQNNRGDVALSLHDLDAAAVHFERSLDILRVFGDTANVARALYNLGAVAVEQERVDDARTLLGESIALANNVGDSEDVAWCLIALAAVSAHTRQPLDGVRHARLHDRAPRRIGATMKPFEQNLYTRTHQTLHSALGDHAFEDALDDGARLQLADIIELATRMSPPTRDLIRPGRAARKAVASTRTPSMRIALFARVPDVVHLRGATLEVKPIRAGRVHLQERRVPAD